MALFPELSEPTVTKLVLKPLSKLVGLAHLAPGSGRFRLTSFVVHVLDADTLLDAALDAKT
jgi:hypothetical protein